jgi:hypothetical protein
MAYDAFLKLDDVNGEVQDSQFEKWIEVFSFSWGASNARTARVEPGGWTETSARVRLAEGIEFGVNLDRYGSALATTLDGAEPVRNRLAPLAVELGVPETELAAFAANLLRHLVEHGLVVPAP